MNNDIYAFPGKEERVSNGCTYMEHSSGMSLRDYYAGQALSCTANDYQDKPVNIANWAYKLADAMLEERSK